MYLVSTMVFPSMFFWFFAVPSIQDLPGAKLLTGSFCAFAVLGVVFFQLAVQTAHERGLAWSRYLRCLPLNPFEIVWSRLLASVVLAVAAVFAVLGTALLTTPLHWQDVEVLRLLGALLLASLPFVLWGLIIGYLVSSKAAVPVANLVYLPLSFAGGLWMPKHILPKMIQDLAPVMPTRMLGEVAWAVVLQHEMPQESVVGLTVTAAVGAFIFVCISRRESSRRG